MAKDKITAGAIDSLRRRAARDGLPIFLWDTELQGFGAKAWPSGQVAWVVQKWIGGRGGKAKRVVVGRYPGMELEQAKREAGEAITQTRKGDDLVDRRAKTRIAKRASLNASKFGDTVERYLKRKRMPGRFWSELAGRFDREIIPKLGKDTLVASITKADLRRLIEAKEETHPVAARTLFEALRPFFKWCVAQDIIAVSPIADLTPPPAPQARERILSDKELVAFWSATNSQFLFGPLHQLLLLTAQRRDEVGAMRWSELDLAKAEWIIPKERTKNSKEHLVHLSPQALAILRGVSRFKDSDLVFTTTGATPVSGYSKAKAQLDKAMLTKPWRVHDLRRTAASGMAALGFQPHIVERVLNHVSGAQGGLVGVYQRHEYIPQRKQAIDAWGNYVEQLVSGVSQSNIVHFTKA